MANLDDDFDADSDVEDGKKKIDRKKILVFLLPALIAIGLVVSFYSVFSKKPGRRVFLTPLSNVRPKAKTQKTNLQYSTIFPKLTSASKMLPAHRRMSVFVSILN